MRTLKEIQEDCKKCAETLTVKESVDKKSCDIENCKIKQEYEKVHREVLCKTCEVFGCSNNPRGTGSRGVPLLFAIPDECSLMDCDASL